MESESKSQPRTVSPHSSINVGDCSNWSLNANGGVLVAGVVNCFFLKRAEQRFGNGDGVYTLDEQTKALNAYYDVFNGPQNFYGAGRNVRLGFELNF